MDAATIIARAAELDVRFEVEDGRLYFDAAEPLSEPDLAFFRRHKAELLAHLTRPQRVYLDFETASRLDLGVAGSAAYAEDESTCVLILCFAIGDGPVQTWRPGSPMPAELRQAIAAGATIVAHNISFERAIWQHLQEPLGWPSIPWHQWSDTSVRARHARLPGSLEGAAEALQLPVQKDREGKALMQRLAKTAYRGGYQPTPEEINRLSQYCAIDVAALREIDRRVPELDPDAAAIAEMDSVMNARGMPVDVDTARKLIEVRDREDARLVAEMAAATEGAITSPTQVQRILRYLSEHGVKLPNCTAETLEAWLEENPDRDDIAANVIRIRGEFAHSSGKKLEAILQAASGSGLVRNTFLHHGAHTGRWAGRGAQLQNLPRNKLADAEATLARLTAETALPDDGPDAKLSIKAQIAGVLRGLFLAPEGEVFVACDLSQIESRVLCWLAGQVDKLDLYRADQDLYLPTAQQLGSNDRNLGKLVVLGAGYSAGAGMLLRKAPSYGLRLTEVQAHGYIDKWRMDNAAIVAFWNALLGAFRHLVEAPLGASPVRVGKLSLRRTKGDVRIALPSGRELVYRNPRMVPKEDGFGFDIVVDLPRNGALRPTTIWRGLLAENVTQAVACDVLTHGMLLLHREGVRLVGAIHDEIIIVTSEEHSEKSKRNMLEVLRTPPAWTEGLPLAAEGYVNRRFLKPPKEQAPKPVAEFPPAEPRSWKTDPALRPTPKRDGPDFWPTPPCLVAALVHDVLPHLPPGVIWEPAAGSLVLVDALRRAGRTVVASDIETGKDFLACPLPSGAGLIITNPPFNLHSAFIDRALELMDSGQVDAVVLLFRHDHTQQESQQPPHCRLDALRRATIDFTCPWRPRWIAGSTGNGRWTFHWIVWIRDAPRQPPEILTRRNPDGSFAKTKGRRGRAVPPGAA